MAIVLIIEDEADLVATLEYKLAGEGHTVRTAATGRSGLEAAWRDPTVDLVLLDLMLPDLPGTEVCRQLRAHERTRHTPIVMMTARGEEIDRVVGFEVGADDYVVKPFSVREMMLRVRAVLRRAQPEPPAEGAGAAAADATLVAGPLRVDRAAHRVEVDGQEVALTALEFRLLTTLLERRGRVQSRETLLSDVWGYTADVTTRTVDTHIKRLRSKLGDQVGAYIETLRGVGYRFRNR